MKNALPILVLGASLALFSCVSAKGAFPKREPPYRMSREVREGLEDISAVFDIPLETVYSLADDNDDHNILQGEYYGLMRRAQAALREALSGKAPEYLGLSEDEGLKN